MKVMIEIEKVVNKVVSGAFSQEDIAYFFNSPFECIKFMALEFNEFLSFEEKNDSLKAEIEELKEEIEELKEEIKSLQTEVDE
jgi:uncharacterized coiled-coil DUF342 family protein